MADMIDDITVGKVWVNAHTATGLTAGVALVVQNKGPFSALIFVGDTAPAADTTPGFRMVEGQPWGSDLGDVVWLRSEGISSELCVQEA